MGSLRKNTVFERRGRDARRSALLEVKSFSMIEKVLGSLTGLVRIQQR
jgi:hypothetical protein